MIMKKILLGLVMLLTTATMNAQIELEHVVEGVIYPQYRSYLQQVGMDDYYVVFTGDDMREVYNTNMELVLSTNEYARIFAKNVFTTDGKICYVAFVENKDVSYLEDVVISDEEGHVLKIIPNAYTEPYPFLLKMHDGYKFIVYIKNLETNVYETHIYSCPGDGETATSVEYVPAKVKRNAYPNPATDLVTLPYEVDGATSMKIYDMQGKLVERKFLDKSKQELQLNVKNYPTGMYFFEVNGESSSFIVD